MLGDDEVEARQVRVKALQHEAEVRSCDLDDLEALRVVLASTPVD